ncbi:MAG: hypothetical protein QOF42_615 [Gammaproteobacteria bacterium]|jgi:hypothetical protein|nr:hypothetical protein [Gammaproteobacteria bacterium]
MVETVARWGNNALLLTWAVMTYAVVISLR